MGCKVSILEVFQMEKKKGMGPGEGLCVPAQNLLRGSDCNFAHGVEPQQASIRGVTRTHAVGVDRIFQDTFKGIWSIQEPTNFW